MQSKSLTILDKREVESLEMKSGLDLSGKFVLRDWEGGIWVGSAALSRLDFSKLNVSSVGIRVARLDDSGRLVAADHVPGRTK